MPLIPGIRRQKQEDLSEFKVSLILVKSRTARTIIVRSYLRKKSYLGIFFFQYDYGNH